MTLVFFIAYSFMIANQTFTRLVARSSTEADEEKVIGGFRLTDPAKRTLQRRSDLSIQDYFNGVAFDPDKVWTRMSRSLAKTTFGALYLGLVWAGTVALACAAMLIEAA